jgi:hypothetical protein
MTQCADTNELLQVLPHAAAWFGLLMLLVTALLTVLGYRRAGTNRQPR